MAYLHIVDPSLTFDFEPYILSLNIILTKPPQVPICKYFLKGQCRLRDCPYKHPLRGKSVVCKHWLRGLCKKGDMCMLTSQRSQRLETGEFLHEYNLKKMPECWFFTKLGECTNPECQYLHIDPNAKVGDCEWYSRGFCRHGSECRHKHTRLAVCQMYICGFCPKGENCEFGHPKFEMEFEQGPLIKEDVQQKQGFQNFQQQGGMGMKDHGYRKLTEVTCFKCGENGHYANHCNQKRKMDEDGPIETQG